MKLNRKLPFGTCHGEDELGRAYYQDGVYFDLEDNAVGDVSGGSKGKPKVSTDSDKVALTELEARAAELDAALEEKSTDLQKTSIALAEANAKIAALEKAAAPAQSTAKPAAKAPVKSASKGG